MTALAGRRSLQAFDHEGVRLLPSRYRSQVDHAAALYGGIDNDSLLKGFRRNAGLPAPGEDLKGWASATSSVIFGQIMGGLARLGHATGDAALIAKARALFAGWRETLPADGNAKMRLYDWEKLLGGLLDLHQYAGEPDALAVLERTTRWAMATFDRARHPANAHDFWGAGPGDTSEWYTLSENLYRAYQLSGNALYREFAEVWHYDAFWGPFEASALPGTIHPAHAYSHVNSFSSAAKAYEVSGDARFLKVCVNAYDFLQATQCYATGGFGPDERLMPADGSLGRSLEVCTYHAEEPCGAWAGFKLARYLMEFTGEARYGDWIETLLINTIGAALPPLPDGQAYYYGNYSIAGGTRQRYWQEWPCCSGTYLTNMAEYHNLIYFQAADGLSVNLFIASEVSWTQGGSHVRLIQTTNFPDDDTTTLALALDRPASFSLRMRVPGWCPGMTIALSGAPLEVAITPGQWATITREWRDGDTVTLHLPMTLRLAPVDRQHPTRAALVCGPVVLAQDEACCRRPFSIAPATALESRFVREPGLRFRITNTVPERHTRYLQPIYSFPQNWPYWMYFDLQAPSLY